MRKFVIIVLAAAFAGCGASEQSAATPAKITTEQAVCSCEKGKQGETVWCASCDKGYIGGEATGCQGCVNTALGGGGACESCQNK